MEINEFGLMRMVNNMLTIVNKEKPFRQLLIKRLAAMEDTEAIIGLSGPMPVES
jgi:hypothetical protein